MNNSTTKTLSWLIVLAGIWEVISPWVLGFSNLPSVIINAVITGALLIIYGLVAAFTRSSGLAMVLNWLNALVGLWLIVAPFVMGFAALSYAAEISSIIVGAVAVIFVTGPFQDEDKDKVPALKNDGPESPAGIPVVQVKLSVAEKWLAPAGISIADFQKKVDADLVPRSVGSTGVRVSGRVALAASYAKAP